MGTTPERIDYPEVLRTLGLFAYEQQMSEIGILEFDHGWILSGVTFRSTASGFMRVPVDFILSHDEIREMVRRQRENRRDEQKGKRRWF